MYKIMCDCATFENTFLAVYELGCPEGICTLIGDVVQNLVHLLGMCDGSWFIC